MLIIDKLIEKIEEKSCPIVVGLDPIIDKIPEMVKQEAEKEYGNTLRAAAEALFLFNRSLIEKLHTVIPAVKLQMACYEMYGQWGLHAFQRSLETAKEFGLMVINDSKRSDIGNTAGYYASGHLGSAPLIRGSAADPRADFMTINPFLGSDSIAPFVEECHRSNKGLFILARTSNSSAADYQEALVEGKPLYQRIAADIQQIASHQPGRKGYSSIGAVVGATWPKEITLLRSIMPSVFFLVPGYGAQGATADQLVNAFDKNGLGALINSSRAIIFAYQAAPFRDTISSPEHFADASLEAVLAMRDDLLRSLRQADKLPDNW